MSSSIVTKFSNKLKNGMQKATLMESLSFMCKISLHGLVFSVFLTFVTVLCMYSGYWMVESATAVFDFRYCDPELEFGEKNASYWEEEITQNRSVPCVTHLLSSDGASHMTRYYELSEAVGFDNGLVVSAGFRNVVVMFYVVCAFYFLPISMLSPAISWGRFIKGLKTHKFKVLICCTVILVGYVMNHVGVLNTGVTYDEDVSAEKLKIMGRGVWLVGMFPAVFFILKGAFEDQTNGDSRKTLNLLNWLSGPTIMCIVLASVLMPKYVLTAFVKAPAATKGVLASIVPSLVFFLIYTWQRISIKRLLTNYGPEMHNVPCSFVIISATAVLWSRILVAGNIPLTSEVGSSLTQRFGLFATSLAASIVTMFARSTAEVRDIRTEKLCQRLCRCSCGGGTNAVAPGSSDDSSDSDEKTKKDKINLEADMVGYGLIVLDVMIDWAAMMAFSTMVMIFEIYILDVSAGDAFASAVMNFFVQLIPDFIFSFAYLHFTLLDYRELQDRITTLLPQMSWWWMFNVVLFAGPVVRLGVSGLTLGVLGDPLSVQGA